VIQAIVEGRTLSAALARVPGVFDALFVAMVASAERHGQLPETLRDHAAHLQWTESLRARLVAAAVYPVALLLTGAAVVLFLLLYVLPRFAGVFDGVGANLPIASRWLMSAGTAMAQHRVLVLLFVAAAAAVVALARRSSGARDAVVSLAWRVPAFERRLRIVALARFYRTVGLLAGAGVTVPVALGLAGDTVPAPLRAAVARSRASVTEGRRLSEAMKEQGLATPVAWRMLKVGEGTGELATMLERAAAFHDEEISRMTELVTRALTPILMLVMGLVIGGIVVLMYLPIFTLMEQVQ
jgi:general secretion pathway protein F